MRYKPYLWRIFLSFLAIIFIALSAITWYATDVARNFYYQDTFHNLKDRAQILHDQILVYLDDHDYEKMQQDISRWNRDSHTRITVILTNGSVVADSKSDPDLMNDHSDRPEIKDAFKRQVGSVLRFSETIQQKLMYVAMPVIENDRVIAVIRTALPITSIDRALDSIQQNILIAGFFILLVTGLIGWMISKYISAPLSSITEAIGHFASGEFDYRLPASSSKELGNMVTALNQMAEQLDEKIKTIDRQKNEQQAVFQSMAEGVVAVNREEEIISINRAAIQLLGITEENAKGKQVNEIIKVPQLQKIITTTLQNGSTDNLVEDEIIIQNSGEHFVHVQGTILQNPEQNTIGVLIVLNDVTRMRQLEQVRSDFVANVSHEIRTPLTSIKGFVETLNDGAIDEPDTARRFLEIIIKQTDRLNYIIGDLLSLASLEQDEERVTIQFEDKLVREVIYSAIHICQPNALQKNIHLEVNCDAASMVKMNSTLIEQALVNLIENAIKYSPADTKVYIDCAREDDQFQIKVRDEGMGIEKEHLARIFERFYRVDKARSRKLGGTGLGLAIVKHIARVHEGNVTVDSEVNVGSTFTLYLPCN